MGVSADKTSCTIPNPSSVEISLVFAVGIDVSETWARLMGFEG